MSKETSQALAIAEGKEAPKTSISLGVGGTIKMVTVDELMRLCRWIVNSKMAPKGIESPEAALMIIQHGAEVGLQPMQALRGIAFINGRPSVFGDAALAICMAHPAFEDKSETYNAETQTARCMMKRKGQTEVVRTFSVDDAKRANLWGKTGPWSLYPQRMLTMRARSWAMRDAFPDALAGLSIAEEVQDIKPIAKINQRPASSSIVLPDEEPIDVQADVENADITSSEQDELKW